MTRLLSEACYRIRGWLWRRKYTRCDKCGKWFPKTELYEYLCPKCFELEWEEEQAVNNTHCLVCKDTGEKYDGEVPVYCDCPIGEAFSAAWMGTGNEEEAVAAIEKMRKFLLTSLS